MKIHVHIVTWNEERLLPYALRHYERFASRIFVYDNLSVDATPRIVRAHPLARHVRFDSGDRHCERNLLAIKNHAWRWLSRGRVSVNGSEHALALLDAHDIRTLEAEREQADFVFVVDTDEILHAPDMLGLLARYRDAGITMPRTLGYEMVSDRGLPPAHETSAAITDLIRTGVREQWYDEQVVFDPRVDVEFAPGCHFFESRSGPVRESARAEIKFLHFKMISEDYYVARNRAIGPRSSEYNVSNGFGYQHRWSEPRLRAQWRRHWRQAVRVL